jgi:hypothetical protein
MQNLKNTRLERWIWFLATVPQRKHLTTNYNYVKANLYRNKNSKTTTKTQEEQELI